MNLRLHQKFSVLVTFMLTFLWSSVTVSEGKKLLIIDSQVGDPYKTVRESMLKKLDTMGYTEESGFTSEYYSLSHYHGAAKNLWQHRIQKIKYDAIFLNGTLAADSFRQIAFNEPDIGFVYAAVTDPVGLGVIDDHVNPPKANFTGISFHVPVELRIDFVRKLIPSARSFGVIYADMPQSHSYNQWLEELSNKPEWKDMTLHYRKVGFIPSDGGHHRMAQISKKYIVELDPMVDVFLSPNDQMGAQSPFSKIVSKTATKPLIGMGKSDVVLGWGAVASIYPEQKAVGHQAAVMIDRIFKGEKVKDIVPERPAKYGMVIDQTLAKKYGISISDDLRKTAEIIH